MSEDLEAFDHLVHEPARLVILTTLASCASADFTFLGRMTGLTNGNLSSHLTKLEDSGLVAVEKRFVDREPHTRVAITPAGRRAVERHWSALDRLRRAARGARPRARLRNRVTRVNFSRAEADG